MVILIALKDNIAIIYFWFTVILYYNTKRQYYHEMALNYKGKFLITLAPVGSMGPKHVLKLLFGEKIANLPVTQPLKKPE